MRREVGPRARALIGHGRPAALALVLAAGPSAAQALAPVGPQLPAPFAGSAPVNDPVGPLSLSLKEAIELGLKRNRGVLLRRDAISPDRHSHWRG